jgi:hypothetical protein
LPGIEELIRPRSVKSQSGRSNAPSTLHQHFAKTRYHFQLPDDASALKHRHRQDKIEKHAPAQRDKQNRGSRLPIRHNAAKLAEKTPLLKRFPFELVAVSFFMRLKSGCAN